MYFVKSIASGRQLSPRGEQAADKKGPHPLLTFSPVQRKSAITVITLILAALSSSSLLGVLIEKTPLSVIDQHAESYVEKTMVRAAYTFAIVRGLNGMISVIQGTEIAVSPAGVGLNISVGEVLDPINDLAERFSWIMLVSTTSLGVQRILMEMGDWLGLRVLLTMAMILLAVSTWKRSWGFVDLHTIAVRLLILALTARLFIPAVALVSETIYDRFLNRHYLEATATLTHIEDELKQTVPTVQEKPESTGSASTLQELRRWMTETKDLIDFRAKIELLGAKLERFTEDTVRLMVVFIFQTIVIPFVMLWVLARMVMLRITPAASTSRRALPR